MEKRQRFSAEFKCEALRLMQTSGKPAAVVARELGVPCNRLYKWADEASKKGDAAFGGSGRPKASNDEVAVLKRELARLREENEILKKSGGVLRASAAVKYAWIEGMKSYSVQVLCHALGASSSGYYAWKTRQPSERDRDNQRLAARMGELHRENHEAYGSERMWRALQQERARCGRHRVRRLRYEHSLRTRRRLRYLRTKSAYQRIPPPPNRLG